MTSPSSASQMRLSAMESTNFAASRSVNDAQASAAHASHRSIRSSSAFT